MGKKDPRVDAYIAKSAVFAQPILKHLRKLVHLGCPEVEETLKWNMPAFVHKGLLGGMAAFKRHAVFGFWNHELVVEVKGDKSGMGQFGRLTLLSDLPPDKALLGYIRKAAGLNEAGIKPPSRTRPKTGAKRAVAVPDYFAAALKKNERARKNFEKFSYSHKREYVEWVSGAKRDETRQKRLATALAWIAEGKPQNWRYTRG